MRVLVTGASGLLGSAVVSEAEKRDHEVFAVGRDVLDVTDPDRCLRTIMDARAEAVIHCAAYTDVDGAETEEPLALAVNRDGSRNVARAAREASSVLVYLSTDYVFDGTGDRPYTVADPPNPLGAYGRSKLAGEYAVRASGAAHLIVRTSWLYGAGGRNFVDTVRRVAAEKDELRVVADQRGRPTWSGSLAGTLLDLVERGATGMVHASDSGTASWFELAGATLEIAGISTRLIPVTTAEWGAAAPRPAFSVLDLEETEALLDRPFPVWRDSLETYLGGIS